MLNTEPPSSSPHFPSGGPAGPVPETPKNVGAETLPLTAINARSKREGEASPGDRSSLLSAKDRNRRINRSGASSRGISNVPPGSWRRNTHNSDFSMSKDSGPFARTLSNFGGDHTVHVSTISPGPVYPHQNQLAVAYGYAVRREDGTYTRLVRADEIVGLTRVPPTQESCEGLIVLPPPELPHPDRRTGSQLYATAAVSGCNDFRSLAGPDHSLACEIPSPESTFSLQSKRSLRFRLPGISKGQGTGELGFQLGRVFQILLPCNYSLDSHLTLIS